jgi:hypothetical protein
MDQVQSKNKGLGPDIRTILEGCKKVSRGGHTKQANKKSLDKSVFPSSLVEPNSLFQPLDIFFRTRILSLPQSIRQGLDPFLDHLIT